MPLSMNIGHRIGSRSGPAPIPRSVAALLRRKGASMVIPGVGVVDGFTAGNYFDSTGLTPAVIDGKVGRANDAGFGGIHALQATDGFKPVERRGLVNLLTYSNDFSNAAWNKGGSIAPSVTGVDPFGGAETTFTSAGNTPSVSQSKTGGYGSLSITFAFLVKKSGTRANTQWAVRNDTTASIITTASFNTTTGVFSGVTDYAQIDDSWYLATISVASGFSITDTIRVYAGCAGATSPVGETYVIGSTAVFTGTVTAQQIIDAGGIPVTTTEPKSSSLGPRYFYTDGTDDHLQTLFIPGSSFTITAAYQLRSAAGGAMKCVVGGKSSTGDRVYVGGYNGFHSAILGTGLVIQSNVPDTQLAVCTLSVTGGVATLRVNGVVKGTLSGYGTALPGVGLFIGAINNSGLGPTNFADANIHAVEMANSTLTDAELLLLEKFAGKLAGVQI